MRHSQRPPKAMQGQGLPADLIYDWRNGETYPKPHSLNDTFWRWEFLRRRADYRQDWDTYAPETYAYELACANNPAYPTRYRKRVFPPDHPAFKARMPHALEKYHLSGLPNPAIPRPWMFSFDSNYGRIYFGQGPDWLGGGEEVTLCLSEWRVAALFDLKKPLSSQIEKVKGDLLDWQKHLVGRKLERRKCRDEWPLYLQVLDAVALNVSLREFGQTVLTIPDEETAEARAEQLYKKAVQISRYFPV